MIRLVELIHEEHPSFGYHDINATIYKQTRWKLSSLTVHKVCKYLGIKSEARHYQWKKPGDEHVIYKNIVSGNWEASRPLEIVASDMTMIKHRGKRYEWTFVIDIFSNSIIASSISSKHGDNLPYHNCLKQLIQIIEKEDYSEPIIFHSDQGTVYSSKGFQEAHKNYNIIRSMSRVGTPTDNAVIESLNGWIKAEIRCDYNINEWNSIEEFIDHYIHFFNNERPAYKHKYKTPAQFLIEQGLNVFY